MKQQFKRTFIGDNPLKVPGKSTLTALAAGVLCHHTGRHPVLFDADFPQHSLVKKEYD